MHFYQLAIPAPKPPAGSFNSQAAEHGKAVFEGKAKCATCYVPLANAHSQGDRDRRLPGKPVTRQTLSDDPAPWAFYPDEGPILPRWPLFRPSRCRGHYNKHLKLNLTEQDKSSLIEYLKSL